MEGRTGRPPELIDGVLVEKTVGYLESRLACELIIRLGLFVEEQSSNRAGGSRNFESSSRPSASSRRLFRLCATAFPVVNCPRWRFPGIAPDLAIEVISESNTPGEMQRKLRDYFAAEVRLVWYIDPRSRTAMVYTAVDNGELLTEVDVLDGGAVLPGFSLPLNKLFAKLEL